MRFFLGYLGVLAALAVFLPAAHAKIPTDVMDDINRQFGVQNDRDKCVKSAEGDSPDSEMDRYSVLPKRVKAASDVIFHDGDTTDRTSNAGIVAYNADTVNTDDKFFALSVRFLKKVKEIDKKEGHDYKSKTFQGKEDNAPESKVNIDETASTDVYQLALGTTAGNQYWALRLMATYGHDDERNKLSAVSSSCRARFLDTLKPKSSSVLYRPGSLGKQGYPKSLIDKGKGIAKACSNPKFTFLEKALCNDNVPDYRADYYHLMTSAFLKCRRTAVDNSPDLGGSLVPAGSVPQKEVVDALYLNRVHQYKVDRFHEELDEMPKRIRKAREEMITKGAATAEVEQAFPDQDDLIAILEDGLAKIEGGAKLSATDFTNYAAKLTSERFSAAKAILARYEFEISFRVYQHTLGMMFGDAACKDLKSLKLTNGELEKACLN